MHWHVLKNQILLAAVTIKNKWTIKKNLWIWLKVNRIVLYVRSFSVENTFAYRIEFFKNISKILLFFKLTFVPPTLEKGSTISCNLRIRKFTSPNCEFPVYIEARYFICFSVNVSICLIFFSLFIKNLMLFILFLILRSDNFTIDKYRIWFEFYYDFNLITISHTNISIKCIFVFCFY